MALSEAAVRAALAALEEAARVSVPALSSAGAGASRVAIAGAIGTGAFLVLMVVSGLPCGTRRRVQVARAALLATALELVALRTVLLHEAGMERLRLLGDRQRNPLVELSQYNLVVIHLAVLLNAVLAMYSFAGAPIRWLVAVGLTLCIGCDVLMVTELDQFLACLVAERCGPPSARQRSEGHLLLYMISLMVHQWALLTVGWVMFLSGAIRERYPYHSNPYRAKLVAE
mmetsp:Transcript_10450/g.33394  ORF Transcript_10450/g.33394 Transcript_10450/m.33394 type:complete len:229 (-) Transcript_10450:266-952(-)